MEWKWAFEPSIAKVSIPGNHVLFSTPELSSPQPFFQLLLTSTSEFLTNCIWKVVSPHYMSLIAVLNSAARAAMHACRHVFWISARNSGRLTCMGKMKVERGWKDRKWYRLGVRKILAMLSPSLTPSLTKNRKIEHLQPISLFKFIENFPSCLFDS